MASMEIALLPKQEHDEVTVPAGSVTKHGEPDDIRVIRRERGHFDQYPIEGYTQLADRLDTTQHFPYSHDTGTVPGCLLKFSAPTKTATGGGFTGGEAFYVLDTAWAPGSYLVQAEILRADSDEQNKLFTALKINDKGDGIRGAFAFFLEDPTKDHPLHSQGQIYRNQHDWTFACAMTSAEANPSDKYVDFIEGNDEYPTQTMLSNFLKDEGEKLAGRLKDPKFVELVDRVIDAFGFIRDQLEKAVADNKADVAFEDILQKTYNDKRVGGHHIRMLINLFIEHHNGNLYPLVSVCRAKNEMEAVKEFEDTYGGPIPKNVAEDLRIRRDNIRKETMESFIMASRTEQLELDAEKLDEETGRPVGINPVRLEISGYDSFNRRWAQLLGIITAGRFASAANQIARSYGSNLPNTVSLIVGATEGNTLSIGTNLKGGRSQESDLYYQGTGMPYSAPNGAFPAEIVESIYNHNKEMMVAGLIARMDVAGPGIEGGSHRMLAGDLLKLPGKVLGYCLEDGLLTTNSAGHVKNRPTLLEILTEQTLRNDKKPTRRDVVIAKLIDGKLKVLAALDEGEGIEFVRSSDTQTIQFNKTKLVTHAEGYAIRRRQLEAVRRKVGKKSITSTALARAGEGLWEPSKLELRQMSRTYEVMAGNLREGEISLGAVMLHNGALHGTMPPPVADGSGGSMKIMRSHGRPADSGKIVTLDKE